jgi:hypothetical protein
MALKSAWELALERTGGKTGKLTDAKKAKLAELEKVYTAKIAERELDLKPKIDAADKPEEQQKLEEILRAQIAKLRAKLEEEKEKVRRSDLK